QGDGQQADGCRLQELARLDELICDDERTDDQGQQHRSEEDANDDVQAAQELPHCSEASGLSVSEGVLVIHQSCPNVILPLGAEAQWPYGSVVTRSALSCRIGSPALALENTKVGFVIWTSAPPLPLAGLTRASPMIARRT